MKDSDFYWLCGLLEGEGSFMKGPPSQSNYPIISVTSTDEDVIQRVSILFSVKYQIVNKRKSHWKQSYTVRIYGRRAVELMTKMHPFMSSRRQQQIDEAIRSYRTFPNRGSSNLTNDQIRQIKLLLLQNKRCRDIVKITKCSRFSIMRIKNHGAFPDIQV
jgi:hypothetical protein